MAQVQSLVKELKSHKLHGMTKRKEEKEKPKQNKTKTKMHRLCKRSYDHHSTSHQKTMFSGPTAYPGEDPLPHSGGGLGE